MAVIQDFSIVIDVHWSSDPQERHVVWAVDGLSDPLSTGEVITLDSHATLFEMVQRAAAHSVKQIRPLLA